MQWHVKKNPNIGYTVYELKQTPRYISDIVDIGWGIKRGIWTK
jgi:hypothetical protein